MPRRSCSSGRRFRDSVAPLPRFEEGFPFYLDIRLLSYTNISVYQRTAAVGAKRPVVEYAIYVVHGTKQRRPIVRHVIGGALHISRKRSRENLQGSPRHCRHSGNVIPCSHRIATISA